MTVSRWSTIRLSTNGISSTIGSTRTLSALSQNRVADTTIIHVSKSSMKARHIDLPDVDFQRAIALCLAIHETTAANLASLYACKLASLSDSAEGVFGGIDGAANQPASRKPVRSPGTTRVQPYSPQAAGGGRPGHPSPRHHGRHAGDARRRAPAALRRPHELELHARSSPRGGSPSASHASAAACALRVASPRTSVSS